MTSDPTRTDDLSPEDQAQLIDLLQGELDAAAAAALEARIAAEPALAAERDALARIRGLEAGRFAEEQAAAAADAPRLAAYIVSRVRADEAAGSVRTRTAGRARRRWARILAVSIGLHVALLGFLTWRVQADRSSDETGATEVSLGDFPLDDWDNVPPIAERFDQALRDMEPEELAALDPRLLRWDGGETDPDLAELVEDVVRRRPPGPAFEFPRGMGLALRRRTNETLKLGRLQALGFDADGTLQRVRLGLSYLRGRQGADGAYAAENGHSDVYQTAVALMAFLGEGAHSKRDSDGGQVVRRGVDWLRAKVFDAAGGLQGAVSGTDRGLVLVALSEDYMLSYGQLSLAEARVRGEEIRALTGAVRTADATVAGGDALWTRWALDAAERTGVVQRSHEDRKRFDTWLATAAREDAGSSAQTAVRVLSRGTALLYADRGADTQGFRSWSRASAEELLGSLLPNGKAKGTGDGPRIAETALRILALQTAYRAY